ncbi:MAG: hypothetical protein IT233_08620 [Bacteroidia bacterium]|nr:hypothetical protein [Bacteroidia bacterium]
MKGSWKFKTKQGEVVSSSVADMWFNEDEILIVKYYHDVEFTLSKAKELIAKCEEMCGGEKVRTMILTGVFGEMHEDTRKYLYGPDPARHRLAAGVVVNNLPHRMYANLISKFRKHLYPTAVFSKETDALNWLRSLSV